eukprot:3844704-Pyramimonas_sp.AAC.1
MVADALRKEKPEAHDLLRACIRSGVHQLADESTTLEEGAAAERERRRIRREASSSDPAHDAPYPVANVSATLMVRFTANGDPRT